MESVDSYLHGRSARELLDLGMDLRGPFKSIWDSTDASSEVDLGIDWGANLGYGLMLIWHHLESILGFILGPC